MTAHPHTPCSTGSANTTAAPMAKPTRANAIAVRTADRLPDVWAEVVSMADLVAALSQPLCSRCHARHARVGQRYCRACHAANMRKWRRFHLNDRGMFQVKHTVSLGLLSEAG